MHARTGYCTLGALVLAILTMQCAHGATIQVDTAADEINTNGLCSLREAVINANNGDQSGSTDCAAGTPPMIGEADSITFSPSLDGTPIVLTLTGPGENAALTGDLDVTDNLGIFGNGPDATIIDGKGADRILDAQPTTAPLNQLSLLVESLTLRNGANVERGGAVFMRDLSSVLVAEDVVITANEVTGLTLTAGGGGIFTEGAMLLRESVVDDNEAHAGSGLPVLGGGIFAGDVFGMTESIVENNLAQAGTSLAQGGGLVAGGDGSQFFITTSSIRGNQAIATGGGGTAGGGLFVSDISGGFGESALFESEVSNNQAIADGFLSAGGGLYVTEPGGLLIRNVTFSGNTAGDSGTTDATGGGLECADMDIIILTSTITDNTVQGASSADGGGIHCDTGSAGMSNTILAGNASIGGTGPDCEGMMISGGYSLLGANAGCTWDAAIGDLIGDVDGGLPPIDPLLEPLADNGGPTRTHALDPTSPAVDAANPATSDPFLERCAEYDQRGYIRPIDGNGDGSKRCDMGALEHASFLDVFFVDGFESE